MHAVSIIIGIMMSVLTVLMIRERILLKEHAHCQDIESQMYVLSGWSTIVGGPLAAVWIFIGIFGQPVYGIWLVLLIVLAVLTVVLGILMVLVCNTSYNRRADTKAAAMRRQQEE